MSLARQTHQRLVDSVVERVADIIGLDEAQRLAELVYNGDYDMPERESITAKVSRLSQSEHGRKRLAQAKTWADIRDI